ncbi:HIT domain-containing protein [Amycolatopsis sp. PS_44_ISF1]|uniref:HIT family protein n=1 Tax=Amycolatopsis sp. PS_44_ISF1 TaxID=2974917 RepID=UPI0028DF24BC|nr:HIT domain-containing protein [Amycolatopsis sp. PS_44_ISF1]MDT8911791.1 HIT domain-containing protein [Amycolatopsis sp. PS_44_ISF1]
MTAPLTPASSRPCVFCRIIRGTAHAEILYEDRETVAFLDNTAVTVGHTLVIPRRHAEDIWEIGPVEAAAVMTTAHHIAALLRRRLDPPGLTLFQANRALGWQDVFHLHLHVVPRYENDRLSRPWRATFADRAVLGRTRALLLGET